MSKRTMFVCTVKYIFEDGEEFEAVGSHDNNPSLARDRAFAELNSEIKFRCLQGLEITSTIDDARVLSVEM